MCFPLPSCYYLRFRSTYSNVRIHRHSAFLSVRAKFRRVLENIIFVYGHVILKKNTPLSIILKCPLFAFLYGFAEFAYFRSVQQ